MSRIADFLYEAGQLKRTERTGWSFINAPHESVAGHTYRACVVGYVLGKMAKLGAQEELLLLKAILFHDLHEARIGDLHRLARKYVESSEKKCEADQRRGLLFEEDLEQTLDQLPEKIRQYAYEADKIECAITAREYVSAGYNAQEWIDNTHKAIKSKEGKQLLKEIVETDAREWLFKGELSLDK